MNGAQAFKVAGVAVLFLAAQVGTAMPCGFDRGLGNTFTPMHPKSLGVAFAVRDAGNPPVRFATPLNFPSSGDCAYLNNTGT